MPLGLPFCTVGTGINLRLALEKYFIFLKVSIVQLGVADDPYYLVKTILHSSVRIIIEAMLSGRRKCAILVADIVWHASPSGVRVTADATKTICKNSSCAIASALAEMDIADTYYLEQHPPRSGHNRERPPPISWRQPNRTPTVAGENSRLTILVLEGMEQRNRRGPARASFAGQQDTYLRPPGRTLLKYAREVLLVALHPRRSSTEGEGFNDSKVYLSRGRAEVWSTRIPASCSQPTPPQATAP
jgi:hypothetical protein